MSIDARRDVLDRRTLAHGARPDEWAVEVAQPVENAWTTTLYVGVQGFQLACGQDREGEQHCMFIGRTFVKALEALLRAEILPLRRAVVTANDLLFDSRVDDPEHQVKDHSDALPEVFLKLAAGHEAAFEMLQEVIREWVEPTPAVGLSGAFSEDLYNEDGSEVTAEQARERNRAAVVCDQCGQEVDERPDRSGIVAHRCPHGKECILEEGDPRIGHKSGWACEVCPLRQTEAPR